MGALWAQARIAYVTLREGNLTEAQLLLTDAIKDFQADQNKSGVAYALEKMANLMVMTDKPEVAAQLIGWSDATRNQVGDPRPRLDQVEVDSDVAAIQAKIGSAAYEAAYQSGRELTLDGVVALALGEK